jgi:two-component system nitrate/nitrite response regulator NarL
MAAVMGHVVKVIVVGNDVQQASGLAAWPHRTPRMRVLGPVPPADAAAAVESDTPDVLLLQRLVPPRATGTVLEDIRRVAPSLPILVSGDEGDHEVISAALSAGACGVVSSTAPVPVMREALFRARAGELVLEDEELRLLVIELAMTRAHRATSRLTERERQVLCGFAEGRSIDEISSLLGIRVGTVQTHMKNAMAKLGVHTKVEAVRLAFRDGLATVPA